MRAALSASDMAWHRFFLCARCTVHLVFTTGYICQFASNQSLLWCSFLSNVSQMYIAVRIWFHFESTLVVFVRPLTSAVLRVLGSCRTLNGLEAWLASLHGRLMEGCILYGIRWILEQFSFIFQIPWWPIKVYQASQSVPTPCIGFSRWRYHRIAPLQRWIKLLVCKHIKKWLHQFLLSS